MKVYLILAAVAIAFAGCKSTEDTTTTVVLANQSDSLAFAIGQSIGQNLTQQKIEDVNPNIIAEGIRANLDSIGWSKEEIEACINTAMMERQVAVREAEEAANALRIEDEVNQLAEIAAREGVVATGTGLLYEETQVGTGATPLATDKVTVHYHGMLLDGSVFDSSVDKGTPLTLGANQFIAGFSEGLQLMKEGGKMTFYIPSELGYGSRPAAGGAIPASSALVFEVELIKVN